MELTARQWLERIADPDLRKKALDNLEKFPKETDNTKYDSIDTALDWAFQWFKTPEGHSYWYDIFQSGITLLPTDPQQPTPEWQPTVGEMFQFTNDDDKVCWSEKIKFLGIFNGFFMAESNSGYPISFKHCRPIEKTFVIDNQTMNKQQVIEYVNSKA